jgi:opacity protein-like surface antigen
VIVLAREQGQSGTWPVGHQDGAIVKKVILCFVAIASLIVTPASAAPPTPAPVTGASWSGLYVDAAFGEEWTRNAWTFDSPFLATSTFSAFTPFSLSTNGAVAGLHIGYQQQFNWLVVGGEFGGTIPLGSHTAASAAVAATNTAGVPPCGIFISPVTSACQATIDSVMTAGGKLGYAVGDWLAYGVGGAAFKAGVTASIVIPGQSTPDQGQDATAHGYYVGGGVDYRLAKTSLADFIVGLEYRHVALDAAQVYSTLTNGPPLPCGVNHGISVLQRAVSTQQDLVWFKATVLFNPLGW